MLNRVMRSAFRTVTVGVISLVVNFALEGKKVGGTPLTSAHDVAARLWEAKLDGCIARSVFSFTLVISRCHMAPSIRGAIAKSDYLLADYSIIGLAIVYGKPLPLIQTVSRN